MNMYVTSTNVVPGVHQSAREGAERRVCQNQQQTIECMMDVAWVRTCWSRKRCLRAFQSRSSRDFKHGEPFSACDESSRRVATESESSGRLYERRPLKLEM